MILSIYGSATVKKIIHLDAERALYKHQKMGTERNQFNKPNNQLPAHTALEACNFSLLVYR